MLAFPSMEKPRFWTSIPCWCSESTVTCSEGTEPSEGEDAQLGNASGREQSVLPGSFPLFMAMPFALWRNDSIQMTTAKSNPLCGAPFAAAAVLGPEMGFGRLGGPALLPPSLHLSLAWRGSAGGLPASGPATAQRWAQGPASRQHIRRHFQGAGLCRFMLKYSCIFSPRLFLLICKCKPLFCVQSVSLMVCQ